MNSNFKEFLRITEKLNEKKIIPLLMGSLGLEYLTKKNWNSRDIDIHVHGDPKGWTASDEERIFNWHLIVSVMNKLQYELIDLHEHEFNNGRFDVEYGVMDTLPSFAKVDLNELKLIRINDIQFYLPDTEQYLKIYTSSYRDDYRSDNNDHKDLKKIDYLKKWLSSE